MIVLPGYRLKPCKHLSLHVTRTDPSCPPGFTCLLPGKTLSNLQARCSYKARRHGSFVVNTSSLFSCLELYSILYSVPFLIKSLCFHFFLSLPDVPEARGQAWWPLTLSMSADGLRSRIAWPVGRWLPQEIPSSLPALPPPEKTSKKIRKPVEPVYIPRIMAL